MPIIILGPPGVGRSAIIHCLESHHMPIIFVDREPEALMPREFNIPLIIEPPMVKRLNPKELQQKFFVPIEIINRKKRRK